MKKSIAILAILMTMPAVANAQFGIAQAVLLAKMLAQSVLQTGIEEGTQSNTGQISSASQDIDKWAVYAAQAIPGLGTRYGWQNLLMRAPYLFNDYYGMASPFVSAEQTGVNAPGAYQYSVAPVVPLNPVDYANMTFDEQQRVGARYSTLDLEDATAAEALGTLGDVQSEEQMTTPAIQALQTDTFSFAPVSLSQTAIGQRQNAGELMNVQESDRTNKLLRAILAIELVRLKAQRDSLANTLYSKTLTGQDAVNQTSQTLVTLTNGLQTFKLP